ncbi:hypothetical protein [Phaeacidiphilus oryzae]|uniref:hypothetical protein n=1 Tax=Phaeacidiphilus oryzae TaxID=348818 RepID=UPI0005671E85|nr:hypothetical protein [Phaeacidiphilus oryzae]
MGEFLRAALGFPAVLFGAALIVVVVFWLLVLVGAADHDALHAHHLPETLGGGSVPVTVPVSFLVLIAWFTSLTGALLVRAAVAAGPLRTVLETAVLFAALLLSWVSTLALVRRLRRVLPEQSAPSRRDFVGLTCRIRTGRVTAEFGQAEVGAEDGSSAVVPVRAQPRDAELLAAGAAGTTGLLYDYDEQGEFFWVAPFDPVLRPETGPPGAPQT